MIFTVTLNPAIDREYTVPALTFDDVLRASDIRVDAGGKGFNVSRLLATLGQPSTALGFVGGKSGEWLQKELWRFGIKSDFVWVQSETRTNTTIVTPDGDHYLKVNEKGPLVSEAARNQLIKQISEAVFPGSIWVLAGSLPKGVPVSFYADLTRLIQEKEGLVFLDTSGEALSTGCTAGPDWIKPNQTEAAVITGEEGLLGSVNYFQSQGINNTVISLGKDGAIAALSEELWHLTPPRIEEKNPIGAGDAMVGGIVWGISQGLSAIEACTWGIACGAMAASKSGTDFGTKEEITALHAEVQISRMIGKPDLPNRK